MKVSRVLVTHFDPPGGPGELGPLREDLGLRPFHPAPVGLDEKLLEGPGGLLALVTGVGPVQAAFSLGALLADPRFHFEDTLWLLAGIGGGDPRTTSLACPVFADWNVDADLAWEFDPSEIPADWETGIIPLGAKGPFLPGAGSSGEFGERFECLRLNPDLAGRAAALVGGLPLVDDGLAREEALRFGLKGAAAAPRILVGANLAGARFWHGHRLTRWAGRWVAFHTSGAGILHTSSMEDSGSLGALRRAADAGRTDFSRVLLLRTVSNFTAPPPGCDPVGNLIPATGEVALPALGPALENHRRVVRTILAPTGL